MSDGPVETGDGGYPSRLSEGMSIDGDDIVIDLPYFHSRARRPTSPPPAFGPELSEWMNKNRGYILMIQTWGNARIFSGPCQVCGALPTIGFREDGKRVCADHEEVPADAERRDLDARSESAGWWGSEAMGTERPMDTPGSSYEERVAAYDRRMRDMTKHRLTQEEIDRVRREYPEEAVDDEPDERAVSLHYGWKEDLMRRGLGVPDPPTQKEADHALSDPRDEESSEGEPDDEGTADHE